MRQLTSYLRILIEAETSFILVPEVAREWKGRIGPIRMNCLGEPTEMPSCRKSSTHDGRFPPPAAPNILLHNVDEDAHYLQICILESELVDIGISRPGLATDPAQKYLWSTRYGASSVWDLGLYNALRTTLQLSIFSNTPIRNFIPESVDHRSEYLAAPAKWHPLTVS